ncbi:hypothetical protein VTN96DRAFT_4015 [Rasamsonia emersonii]
MAQFAKPKNKLTPPCPTLYQHFSLFQPSMDQAKRVILRLRETEIDYTDPYESVRLYLENNGRSVKELEEGRHFVHVQPSNPDIPQTDPKIHIVIDIEKDLFSGTLDETPADVRRNSIDWAMLKSKGTGDAVEFSLLSGHTSGDWQMRLREASKARKHGAEKGRCGSRAQMAWNRIER